MNSFANTTICSSPLGILERLPREMRNVVYEKIFLPSYHVQFPSREDEDDPYIDDTTLNILQASSVVHEEAQPVLYKHSTIVYSYKAFMYSSRPHESPIHLSQAPFKSVEIRMDFYVGPKREFKFRHGTLMPRFCKMFMDQLNSLSTFQTEAMTVTMRFDPVNDSHLVWDRFVKRWQDQPLTPSLGKLRKYKLVVLEWHEACGCTTVRKPSQDFVHRPCDAVVSRVDLLPSSPVWNELGKTLGPRTTEQIVLWDKGTRLTRMDAIMRHRNCHVRRWVYRPRAFANGHGVDDLQMPDRISYGHADCNHAFENLHKY